jgi:hypothetical protein
LNGNDYPSMGNPDFDSLSGMQIDTSTAEFTLKKAGKPIGARCTARSPKTAKHSQ